VFFLGGPQLGELEAGLVAHWWSAPISVVSGGLATMIVTWWIAAAVPQLRRYERESGEESILASKSAGSL